MSEGWAKPINARKFHYFVGGRSLCCTWFFAVGPYISLDEDTGEISPSDCKECAKRMVKRRRLIGKGEQNEDGREDTTEEAPDGK